MGPSTIDMAASAGANCIVAGSSVFGAKEPANVISILRKSVRDAQQSSWETLTPPVMLLFQIWWINHNQLKKENKSPLGMPLMWIWVFSWIVKKETTIFRCNFGFCSTSKVFFSVGNDPSLFVFSSNFGFYSTKLFMDIFVLRTKNVLIE